jgi:hypothetical protein
MSRVGSHYFIIFLSDQNLIKLNLSKKNTNQILIGVPKFRRLRRCPGQRRPLKSKEKKSLLLFPFQCIKIAVPSWVPFLCLLVRSVIWNLVFISDHNKNAD